MQGRTQASHTGIRRRINQVTLLAILSQKQPVCDIARKFHRRFAVGAPWSPRGQSGINIGRYFAHSSPRYLHANCCIRLPLIA
ncbi:unnamed protein product [Nesidiocoris tenuis]|uniref:Uncharacterized protein n=1 Tax=Nesidiocoris tenuis TaxID=355587 RepID=A0A6H5FW99_9HEMI|nr:unnamed protein product [Nesidiocoris tenuis]